MALIANSILVGLSLILGLRLLRRYQNRPRPHTLWYALGLILTALAAFPELYHKAAGSLPTPLWWLYWMSASTLVGFLAVGTAYLISPRFGQGALVCALVLTSWVAVATILTAGQAPFPMVEAAFHKAPNGAIKAPFLIQNIAGALVILGGALLSWFKTRALYNVWIAVGTLVFSSGGAATGLLHTPGIFYVTQALGIVLLYAGVSLSVAPRPVATVTS